MKYLTPVFLFLVLPFPSGTLFAELVLLIFLVLLETTRIFTGWKANLTENVGGMGLCVALFVPGILGVLYFLIWQVKHNIFLYYLLLKTLFYFLRSSSFEATVRSFTHFCSFQTFEEIIPNSDTLFHNFHFTARSV